MLAITFRYLPKHCINACIFCSNEVLSSPDIPEKDIDSDFQKMKEQFLTYVSLHRRDIICITGNDPIQLGVPRLVELFDLIRSYEYTIGFMSTHGRLLAKDDLQVLKEHGLLALQIPLYGSTAEIHNGITRPKIGDAFSDTVKTLEFCEQLGISIIGNIRIVRENRSDIQNIIRLYKDLCPTKLETINLGGVIAQLGIMENAQRFLSKDEERALIESFSANDPLVTKVY